MNITSFLTGVAFVGASAFATTTPTPCSTTSPCGTGPACTQCGAPMPAPCMTDTGSVQGFGQEWLNIDTITLEAVNGNPIAQYTLAYLTDNAAQTPQAKQRAAMMYAASKPGLEAAAAKGNPAACKALAHMCMTGNGCPVDPAKAKKLMKACAQCCTPDCPSTTQAPAPSTTPMQNTSPASTTPPTTPAQ